MLVSYKGEMAAPKSFEEGNPSLNLENILRHRTSNSNAIRQGNPLSGLRYEELRQLARAFVDDHELGPETYDVFEKGSILAQEKNAWRDPKNNLQLSAQEKICLQKETTNKWDQPWQLYVLFLHGPYAMWTVRSCVCPLQVQHGYLSINVRCCTRLG